MSDTKELVLKYLEENKDSFSSGEEIANHLNLSRNSVWKAIKSLRNSGYQIEAATHRGYHLVGDMDLITLKGISDNLLPGIAQDRIHVYKQIESTNKTAKGAAAFDAPHGTCIIAESQTLGSGRKKRPFFSPKGGIYMSVILTPDKLPFKNTSLVTAYIAVCVCNSIEALTGKKPMIKWSNDIYIDNRKICGILTESAGDLDTGELSWIVAGIGINFAVDTGAFPKEMRSHAGSLFVPEKAPLSKNDLIAEILNNILLKGKTIDILKSYRNRSLVLSKDVTVYDKDNSYPAKAVSIDDMGKLVVSLPDGSSKTLTHEEIRIEL